MTYSAGNAWGRKPSRGSETAHLRSRAESDDLKAVKRHRMQSPLTPVKALRGMVPAANQRAYSISTLMDNGATVEFEHYAAPEFYLEDIFACFGRGTLVATDFGKIAIEDLRPGDRVKTRDNGLMAVRWIGSCSFGGPETANDTTGFPIRIKADALGELRPEQDLIVSPRFRVLSNNASCKALFGSSETLAPAIDLMDHETIMQVRPPEDLRFYNLMLDSHQIIRANGLETESYHPGNVGLSVMSLELQHHLRQIFPHLEGDLSRIGRSVRPILKGFETEVLRAG